jgi:hypothetical protein
MRQTTSLPKWLLMLAYFSSACAAFYFGFYALETYKQVNWFGFALALGYCGIATHVLFTLPYVSKKPEVQTVAYAPIAIEASEAVGHIYPTGEYVYLIQDTSVTGYFKIGKTNNPSRRMYDFGVLLPMQVKVIHVIPCQNMSRLEAELHRQYRDQRINGEWFALSPDDIAYIKQL